MGERLRMFTTMPEGERRAAMEQMIDAVSKLDASGQRNLVRARTKMPAELPDEQRKTLMRTHTAIVQSMSPERMVAEMKLVQATAPELTARQRQAIEQPLKMMPTSAAPAMGMDDMIQALAQMPETQRRTMMGERLAMFAELSEERRRGAMKQMLEALGRLPEASARLMVKTRTQVLCDLPANIRDSLMGAHMAVLTGMPSSQAQRELQLVNSIVPELTASQRQTVTGMMEKMRPMMATMGGGPRLAVTPTLAPHASVRLAGWGAVLLISPSVVGFGKGAGAAGNDVTLGIIVIVLAGIVGVMRPSKQPPTHR